MNERILFFSCIHAPFSHPDYLVFLKEMKKTYKPTRIINLGDTLDFHSLSYHESDPEAPGSQDEFTWAKEELQGGLMELFPDMDIMASNHTDIPYRKARSANIPSFFMKNMGTALNAPEGWKYHKDLTLVMPDGREVLFCHGRGANVVNSSKTIGKSIVQGHHHSKFSTTYYGAADNLKFGTQCCSLIDNDKYAFRYNKTHAQQPLLGAGMLLNGWPLLEPMV